MLYVTFGKKSSKDRKFTINTSELQNGGILSRRTTVKEDDRFNLTLVTINGVVVEQEFKASRGGSTLMATDILSPYLFGEPAPMSYGAQIGVCAISKVGARVTAHTTSHREAAPAKARPSHIRPTKKAIKEALRNNDGNKSATAEYFGVSPRTFGRWLEA